MDLSGQDFSAHTDRRGGRGRGFTSRGGANKNNNSNRRDLGLIIDRSTRVYIRGIPHALIEKLGDNALRAECEGFGELDRYVLHTDQIGNYSGNALATYKNADDAQTAIEQMNHSTFDGHILEVSMAKTHGVHLMGPKFNPSERRNASAFDLNSGDVWKKDKFDPDATPESVRGRGRGGRGGQRGRGFTGRGRGGNSDREEQRREKASRTAPLSKEELDAELSKYSTTDNNNQQQQEGQGMTAPVNSTEDAAPVQQPTSIPEISESAE